MVQIPLNTSTIIKNPQQTVKKDYIKLHNNERICNRKLYFFAKRAFDIILSIIGIVLLSPIFILTAILIKVTSKGPVIFKQLRSGKNKTHFYMYKFRTMKNNAPQNLPTKSFQNSTAFVTRVGKFLRKTSVDELPQLFNILSGDMSIVGPRPVVLCEKLLINEREKYFANSVRPGLTGWAQVNGRDELNEIEKAKFDGYYIQNVNFILDFIILIKTIKIVFSGKGIIEGNTVKDKAS
jgi:Sugar transferases involved in lipopolysaccharide synthesis